MNANKWKKVREGYIKIFGTYMVEFIEAGYIEDEERKAYCNEQVGRLTKAYCWALQKETQK